MALFFDADWFDARLAGLKLDRAAMAEAVGVERADLNCLFANKRAATGRELSAFAALLGVDIVEVTLRAGVAMREPAAEDTASARIESIEARLDAIDTWLAEFEREKKRA